MITKQHSVFIFIYYCLLYASFKKGITSQTYTTGLSNIEIPLYIHRQYIGSKLYFTPGHDGINTSAESTGEVSFIK